MLEVFSVPCVVVACAENGLIIEAWAFTRYMNCGGVVCEEHVGVIGRRFDWL